MSGHWFSITVDDEHLDGGVREIFRSETVEIDDPHLGWKKTLYAEEAVANVALVITSPELLDVCKTLSTLCEGAQKHLGLDAQGLSSDIQKALARARDIIGRAQGENFQFEGIPYFSE